MPHKQSSLPTPPSLPNRSFRRGGCLLVRFLGVVVVVCIGAWAGVYGASAWRAAHAPATPPSKVAVSSLAARQAAEGTDTAPLPTATLDDYTVASDLPRALFIDKLQIAARILPMNTNPDGSMQAPININDSGWYTGSAKPGMTGAVVLDGHSSATGTTRQGLFGSLATLVNGDMITIEKGNGEKLQYKVVASETVALAAVDMIKAMKPYGDSSEGLTLITCSGQWTAGSKTLDHRTIVYAVRV